MPPDRWLQVKTIVSGSLELEPERREAYVRDACHGDLTLARDVNSLLASYDGLGDFLATSVIEDDTEELAAGSRVGHYEIRDAIAEGGMGTVYRAVRASDFEKQVAVKVVKRGMDTNFILRQFRYERQILAGLDHPNIARLLDGGATEDGRPYLVMEYIEGRPITAHAEEQGLSVSERLELFRKVCSAVQYAHQNLVVHRDLKAGNILVTPSGVPKLLDFGIAKLLESAPDVTATSLRLMTPECASPEQVRGEALTTATDIYSLGVLLYELLTGKRPYQFATRAPDEVRRLVCDTDPDKPSAVRRLSPDLDHIVLKAMHKDPARRYVSAEQLSQDLRRYLQGLPIDARSDTTWYRASKFIGRHKAGTAAAAALAISLAGGAGATAWQARLARSERARAERRFNDVRELANSLIFDVHDAIRTLPGSTAARKLIVDRALLYLDRLASEAGSDDSLRRELARAYVRLGEVQGEAGRSNLGNSAAAIQSLRKAIALFEQVRAHGRLSTADQRTMAGAYDTLSTTLSDAGDRAEAADCDRKALALRQALAGHLAPLEWTKEISLSYHAMGLHRALAGDFAGALKNYRQFLEARMQIARAEPSSAANQRNLSLAHKRVGAVLIRTGKLSEALVHYRAAETLDKARVAADPGNAEARLDLTFASSDIGFILRKQGHWGAALEQYQSVERIRAELAAADPKDVRARSGLARTREYIAAILWHLGDRNQSLAYYRKALDISESLLADDPGNASRQTEVATLGVEIADAYASLAEDSRQPAPQRALLWQHARMHYRRASQLTFGLKARGALDEDGKQAALRASRQLVRCDFALATLTAPRKRPPLAAGLNP